MQLNTKHITEFQYLLNVHYINIFYLVRSHRRSRLTYVVSMFTANIARLKVQNKSKNTITELRTILQWESQTS